MSSYRSFGSLDDNILTDGDVGFLGMNQRLQPNQLGPGEVFLSSNGRIEGSWQPRKGILLRSGVLSNSAFPLALPFWVIDAPITIASASRTSDVVTLVVTAGHGLTGKAYATLGDVNDVTAPIAGIAPGTYEMEVISATELTFDSIGSDGSLSVDATYGYLNTQVDDEAVSEVYGSCLFSDPADDSQESIILATNSDAKFVDLTTYAVTSIPYPSSYFVTSPVELIQAFDKVFLFRDGERTWEWSRAGRPVLDAEIVSNEAILEITAHGLNIGDKFTLSGVTFATTNPNGLRTVSAVVDADTVKFALTGADETFGVSDAQIVPEGFTEVIGGPYAPSQGFTINSNSVSVTDNLLTATVTGNNTIKVGDFVTVHFTEIDKLKQIEGKRFEVVEASATSIKFNVPAGNISASGSKVFSFSGRFSVGGGFSHMPAPPWATYFQRRLWVPYWYDAGGTYDSPLYPDRQIRDEIMASDILDSNTYDQIFNQFRVTAGIADFTVAMQPFYDDGLIVMNRNSLHLIRGTKGSLEDTVVTELTREVGCLARKSVASRGPVTFFLSDDGVYGVEFVDEYNLRGIDEPLSKNIQPFIDRINKSLASNAVGLFFNNRYFLAVPLDSSAGADDAQGNNAILVFNMLNKGWESIDTYDASGFDIRNLLIGQSGKRNSLYLVNSNGGVHEMDAREQPIDAYSTNVRGDVEFANIKYELVSRGYMLGQTNYERKKFSRVQVQLDSGESPANVDFFFSSEDPDTDKFFVGSVEGFIGQDLPAFETGNFRMRLGNPRGLYGTLTISANSSGSSPVGRPKVNSITLDGTLTNRQTISQF